MVIDMKKRIEVVLTFITLYCIIYGCYKNIGPFGLKTLNAVKTTNNLTNEFEVIEVKNLFIDADVMDVNIKTGNDFSIEYDCTKGLEPEYKYRNGDIEIKQKNKNKFKWGITNKCEVNITLPKDTRLEKADININVGDREISDVMADKFIIEANTGDTEIEKCDINELILQSDVGDTTIETSNIISADIAGNIGDKKVDISDFELLKVTSDVGDIEISSKDNIKNYNFDVATDIGEVKAFSNNAGKKYKIDNDDNRKIIVKANVGDIKIK